jgi:hypothetical protein
MVLRGRRLARVAFTAGIVMVARAELRGQGALRGDQYYHLAHEADQAAARGNYSIAIGTYRQLLAADSRDSRLWRALGESLDATGDHRGAAKAFARMIATGAQFESRGDYKVARQWALAGVPDSAIAWLRRAMADRFEGRTELATDTAFVSMRADKRFIQLAATRPENVSRVDGWREDVQFFVSEAQRLHAGFHREAFAPAFLSLAGRIRDSVPAWSDERILVEIRRLATLLGDGHSGVRVPMHRIPVDLYRFTDGVFVIGGSREGTRLIGARVDSIGRLSMDAAMAAVKPYVPRDNDMGWLLNGPRLLAQVPTLSAIGAVRDTSAVDLALRFPDGHREHVRLAPYVGPLSRPTLAGGQLTGTRPLYLSNDSPFWMARLPHDQGLYMEYGAVAEPADETTQQFADRLVDTLRASHTRNLVVDVRNNGGGNTFLFPPLLDAVISFAASDSSHRIYLVVGRGTFSAAQNFATLVERLARNVITVGEPSGSRPNFVGESPTVRLPYSGAVTVVSSRFHQNVDITDKRMWIAPMVPVPVSSMDYFGNRDPVLEAIMDLIRGK